MTFKIVPLQESHFTGLREALDVVSREKRYLAFTQAPPLEQCIAFYKSILLNGHCQYIAELDGAVVGWCDVLPVRGEVRTHIGVLGIGLIPSARHQGLGRMLMQSAIDKAWDIGLTRIELGVRIDNLNAIALYERLGFQTEGIHRRGNLVDGEYFDTCSMALLR
jgi:RimJ/RimL family protein N-acetyltransferase